MTPMEAVFQTSPKCGLTWEQFCTVFADCEFEAITDNGEMIGGVMYRGSEVHLGVLRSPQGCVARKIFRHIVTKVMNRYGVVTALIPLRCAEYAEKLKRFGFVEQSRDDIKIELTMEEIPSWVSKRLA